jgi:hypothetical protein
MDEIDNMDERFHLDEVENKNVVLHYGWNFKTWVRVTIYPYDWISSTLTWIIFMWSIYLEELSFIHVVNVNHMIMFSFYINIIHCTLLIPIISSTFIHVSKFHPCHLLSIMLSISSKWQGSSLWSNFIHLIKFIQMVI